MVTRDSPATTATRRRLRRGSSTAGMTSTRRPTSGSRPCHRCATEGETRPKFNVRVTDRREPLRDEPQASDNCECDGAAYASDNCDAPPSANGLVSRRADLDPQAESKPDLSPLSE